MSRITLAAACFAAAGTLGGLPLAAQTADGGLLLAKSSAAGGKRPVTLPEIDDVFVPTLSPDRVRALSMKKELFPLNNPDSQLARRGRKDDSNDKIVGGTKVQEGTYPFQVAMIKVRRDKDGSLKPTAQFCGGSLITSKWVLTAAHCFAHGEKGKIEKIDDTNDLGVHVGGTSLVGRADRIAAKRVVVHPRYVPGTSVNDIALVELEREPSSLVKSDRVTVVTREAEPEILPNGAELIITGWGRTETGKSSMDLLESRVNAVDRGACNRALTSRRLQVADVDQALSELSFTFNITPPARKTLEQNLIQLGGMVTPQMFCAAAATDGRDTCPGDSGGPIFRKIGDSYVQVGIVSFGLGQCGSAALPGVYTRLSLYTDWLKQVVNAPAPAAASPVPAKRN